MKVTGIIAEYNPFHNGHAWHLAKSRHLTGADYIVVAMSGDFVQRGTPAITDKFSRAEMALRAGADLVLELPAPCALGSAEYFATGAISLLSSLQVVDALCFGSECADLDALKQAADILTAEPQDFQVSLKKHLKEGLSFPSARQQALGELTGDQEKAEALLSLPNNILALEYLKALKKLGSSIQPVPVLRVEDYHSTLLDSPKCSATAIRQALFSGKSPEELAPFLPAEALSILLREHKKKPWPSINDYSRIFAYELLKAASPEDLMDCQDLSPDLARRIFSFKNQFQDLESFAMLLKTKQYTYSRIQRCLTHILLDLKASDAAGIHVPGYPGYIRVLGFRKESAPLLAAIKKRSALPLLTRVKDASKLLSPESFQRLQKDLFASSVYHLTDPFSADGRNWNECSRQFLKL